MTEMLPSETVPSIKSKVSSKQLQCVYKVIKEEIQELGVRSSVDAKRLEQDTATQEFKSSQIHQEKDLVQQKNLQTLSNQLDETIKENKKTTLNYRKKKHKIEKEVENWISKYDVEMQEKEREIQALTVSVLF
jgi:Asp-tRNA(Asn)/Glu-tRNA(Gln) amidotransferase B subunit